MTDKRYLVVRVPGSGPPALVGAPYAFDSLADAEARITAIERDHRKSHHTHLEIIPFEGALVVALEKLGILA